jgi:hypothetical protein
MWLWDCPEEAWMKGWRASIATAGAVALAGCGGEPTPPPPPPPPPSPVAQCNNGTPIQLAVGQHDVIDPAQTNGCVRVPAAGAGGAEYIVVVASTAPTRTQTGVSGPYFLRASNPGASAVAEPPPAAVGPADIQPRPATAAERFHDALREREATLSRDPANRARVAAPPAAAVPPPVGDVRTFKVCGNLQCSSFVDVPATARYVGAKAAIYADNEVPQADPLQDADFQELARTFDTYHYPFASANFGAESDIDANERIVILMTDAVNALTPDCRDGRVLGYFFGQDLITTGPGSANSNRSEIFYTFVPAPGTAQCTAISRSQAVNNVKPTLIHELQHMIAWNQRVILRGGNADETWLNEALSHFAEELAGRQIPAEECTSQGFSSCRSQYISGNIVNSYDYLKDTESQFLVAPATSQATLAERGAAWHFLRWVIDQFAVDSILGADLTLRLVQTVQSGVANLEAATGTSFSRMVPEWLLASYLDDLDGFAGVSARTRFKSWGLRAIWTDPRNAQVFPQGFPLRPDLTSGANFTRSGILRAGSGRHLQLIQAVNGPGIDVQLVRNGGGDAIDPALVARIGIARVK